MLAIADLLTWQRSAGVLETGNRRTLAAIWQYRYLHILSNRVRPELLLSHQACGAVSIPQRGNVARASPVGRRQKTRRFRGACQTARLEQRDRVVLHSDESAAAVECSKTDAVFSYQTSTFFPLAMHGRRPKPFCDPPRMSF